MIPVALLLTAASLGAPPFELRDGDRVVLVGGTFIEREQRYGYWETALTCRFPERNITFRNLGWSGDTVWGESRAGFDSPEEGYKRLVEQTLALKPTVIILGYGTNESFAGEKGLPGFQEQFNKLLDDLAPSKARLVLLAPPLVDASRWPAGKVEERDRALKRYGEAIRQIAQRRHAYFVPEFCQSYGPATPLTDDGMHLTAFGYWWTAIGPLNELRVAPGLVQPIELVGQIPARVRQRFLPIPPVPAAPNAGDHENDSSVHARDLKPGKYTLTIDGRPVQTADADAWMNAIPLAVRHGPSVAQAEKLRQVIVEKNRLYFYRWRPQNVTYLFGFRKNEQGQNAKEIPEFDPLIARLEAEIARLRVPVVHEYALVPQR